MTKYNDPFYFAVADSMPTAEREQVPSRIEDRFGVAGRIEFVRVDEGSRSRIYRRHVGSGS